MRVRSIVREPLTIQRIGSRREQDATVDRLLDEVALPSGAADRYPHEFSGGQRQRIGLARALALNPKLIVADEPVSALDVSVRSQVLNLMRELQQRHGLTYLIISHDLTVVRYVADTLGVMYLGKLVETGDTEEIYRRPAHPYTAALIESIPLPDPAHERAKRHRALRGELPSPANPPSGCRFRTRCPRAQELCAQVVPPLRPFAPNQRAACHFPLKEPMEETT
jgi:oligopeptide/dipeptide ABC transporter ATP-binding protein